MGVPWGEARTLDELIEQVGEPSDPEREGDVDRASISGSSFVLRRDCHGVLRKVEVTPIEARRHAIKSEIGRLGRWQEILPEELDVADVPGLGKVYLLLDRLTIILRIGVDRAALADLMRRLAAVPLADPGALAP